MATYTLTENGQSKTSESKVKFDSQDFLLLVGFVLLETGTILIYIPAALILAGLLFLLTAGLTAKRKS